jgi:hypothetical protein
MIRGLRSPNISCLESTRYILKYAVVGRVGAAIPTSAGEWMIDIKFGDEITRKREVASCGEVS